MKSVYYVDKICLKITEGGILFNLKINFILVLFNQNQFRIVIVDVKHQ